MDNSALVAAWVSRLQANGFAPDRAALVAPALFGIVEGVQVAAEALPFDSEPATFLAALNEG